MSSEAPAVFWHGTPDLSVSHLHLEPRPSTYSAIFLAKDLRVATFYSGRHGVVHGYMIDDSARLLDATGSALLSMEEWRRVAALLRSTGYPMDITECLRDLETLPTPRWATAIRDMGRFKVGSEYLLERRYDGFLDTRRVGWAVNGDRPELKRMISEDWSSPYAKLAHELGRDGAQEYTCASLFDRRHLVHVESIRSDEALARLTDEGPRSAVVDDVIESDEFSQGGVGIAI